MLHIHKFILDSAILGTLFIYWTINSLLENLEEHLIQCLDCLQSKILFTCIDFRNLIVSMLSPLCCTVVAGTVDAVEATWNTYGNVI